MKSWWKSKTFWMNIATFGVASAMEEPNAPAIAQVLAIANIILRFFSHSSVGFRSDD